uniref:CobW/HypB/UreG nucleotide-binding domain-containing protein n=1 Tax=Chromera velia CCMP2878 TaxID=1169474 RepID=A0A0G4IAU0_9ALVE|eukprot:Cvel_12651.t1-p1 / transcript=Cvel_12651.t1 / gene=Cvel_12651 / organism=Chromera_velia_CCMP2878 / gene_product=COBW domain-containing protein 2, putative / transcript_product=COBW domain-containing protein 2, putative / location=Cvel_scaffold835:57179-62965(-) / protein_length=520 / sequence_SO=supercontig / SO=protein_coding / is_pseudo=false
MSGKVPVTVITGFLGAGKTTLLKHIMSSDHKLRIAVIQNEFSEEMGIESPILLDKDGEVVKEIFELPNGCICCSVRDDMVAALDNLLTTYKNKIDYILVETTGIADPEPVTAAFWVDSGLESSLKLDGIVTVVDARNVHRCLGLPEDTGGEDAASSEEEEKKFREILEVLRKEKEKELQKEKEEKDMQDKEKGIEEEGPQGMLGLQREAAKQIACADRIILNKLDTVKDERRTRVEALLSSLNPDARVIPSCHAKVDPRELLGLSAFDTASLGSKALAPGGVFGGEEGAMETGACGECGGNGSGARCGHTASKSKEGIQAKGAHDLVDQVFVTFDGLPPLVAVPSSSSSSSSSASSEKTEKRSAGRGGCLDLKKVERWIATVLWEKDAGIVYRCKGLFSAVKENDDEEDDEGETDGAEKGDGDKQAAVSVGLFALQGVGEVFEIEACPRASAEACRKEAEKATGTSASSAKSGTTHGKETGSEGVSGGIFRSKFLFIGRGLDRPKLEEGLKKALFEGEGE